ncbi:MAG: isoprenylcysteine carboxylmethyltransferase family protein [Candidatus Thorarchaeota archaeon]|nr:isoprenylcysteine carboxylmethyltransferase family protein [Candidatus Thorarchaeota archaeon]
MSCRSHAQSFLLPFVVLLCFPALVLLLTSDVTNALTEPPPLGPIVFLFGMVFMACGLILMIVTIRLFATVGRGTLAPWSPTKNLVVEGPYRYVRNPMISGVLSIALAEALIFTSLGLMVLFLVFLLGNHIYFIKSEEPGLVTRFGDEYLEYTRNVPRWIPRLTPWVRHHHSVTS